MNISRSKTQFMEFKFERNEEIGRTTLQILGDELENATHFKYPVGDYVKF